MTYNVSTLLDRWATGSEHVFILEGEGYSFARVSEESQAVAAGLRELGIGKGDLVAVWLMNHPDWLTVFFACARLGAIVVSVNTRYRHSELADIYARLKPKALICRREFGSINFLQIADAAATAVSYLPPITIVADTDTPETAFNLDCLKQSSPRKVPTVLPDDGLVVFTTSGTTAKPKFVLHTHASISQHAEDVATHFELHDKDVIALQALPYCGVFGFCQAMGTIAAGRPSVVLETFDGTVAAKLIGAHSITHFNATDDMLEAIVTEAPGQDLSSLRLVGAASFNRSPAILQNIAEKYGVPIAGLYGMSEVQALFARRKIRDLAASRYRPGGRSVSTDAVVRIRDPETGRICAAGETGEIELRGPSCFSRYLGDPEATYAAFTDDGFFRTGDLGSAEREGAFTFDARMGDALRLGGFLVDPNEISSFIETFEEIEACIVVGVEARGRPRAAAFVTLSDLQKFNSADLIQACSLYLAPYKVPILIHAVDAFPMAEGANGNKVQLGELRSFAQQLVEN